MKHVATRHDPQFIIEFTSQDLETLAGLCDRHYDPACRGLNQPPGVIYALRRRFEQDKSVEIALPWQTVDLLCKACEAEPEPAPLLHALRALLGGSNE